MCAPFLILLIKIWRRQQVIKGWCKWRICGKNTKLKNKITATPQTTPTIMQTKTATLKTNKSKEINIATADKVKRKCWVKFGRKCVSFLYCYMFYVAADWIHTYQIRNSNISHPHTYTHTRAYTYSHICAHTSHTDVHSTTMLTYYLLLHWRAIYIMFRLLNTVENLINTGNLEIYLQEDSAARKFLLDVRWVLGVVLSVVCFGCFGCARVHMRMFIYVVCVYVRGCICAHICAYVCTLLCRVVLCTRAWVLMWHDLHVSA